MGLNNLNNGKIIAISEVNSIWKEKHLMEQPLPNIIVFTPNIMQSLRGILIYLY